MYGYGVDLEKVNAWKSQEIINYLPSEVKEDYESFLMDNDMADNEESFHDFVNYHFGIYNAGYEGISGLLAVMISEYEKLELYHDDGYLLLCADYPWYMSEREKNLTHEEFISILSKYVKLITDEELEIQTYFIDCDE